MRLARRRPRQHVDRRVGRALKGRLRDAAFAERFDAAQRGKQQRAELLRVSGWRDVAGALCRFDRRDEGLRKLIQNHPRALADGLATTDEGRAAVAFLASDDASFVNGVELFVDGGMAQV